MTNVVTDNISVGKTDWLMLSGQSDDIQKTEIVDTWQKYTVKVHI